MPNPTIVMATLDDNELKQSIANLVAHVKRGLHTMKSDTDAAVEYMQKSLEKIGATKINTGGQTSVKQKELETSTKASTEATKQQTQVIKQAEQAHKEFKATLDAVAAAQKAAIGVNASNSLLAAKYNVTEQQKLHELESQRAKVEDSILTRQMEIGDMYRTQLATLSKTRSELEAKSNLTSKEQADLKHVTSEWERINGIVKDISRRPIVAADDPTGKLGNLEQQLTNINTQLGETRKRIQENNFEAAKLYDGSLSKVVQDAQSAMKYQSESLKKSFEDLLKKPVHDADEMKAKLERLQTFLNSVKPLNIFSPELIANGERAIDKLKQKIKTINDSPTKQAFVDALKLPDRTTSEILSKIHAIRDAVKKVKDTDIVSKTQIANAESLIDQLRNKFDKLFNAPKDRQLRIDFANALKMPTRNLDDIAAKLMRLQWVLQEMRGMEILSPQQIATGNAQIRDLLNKLEAELHLRQQIESSEQQSIQTATRRAELERLYGEEVARAAQTAKEWLQASKETAFRNSEASFVIKDPNAGVGGGMSIERQLLAYKEVNKELDLQLAVEKAIAETEAEIARRATERANAVQSQSKTKKTFADYEDLQSAIAHVLKVEKSEVEMADTQNASYKALSLTLKQLKQAYESLGAKQRDSANADALIERIHETQRAMKEIQGQMSRPISLESTLALPSKTLEEISYKVQMLRAYAQGLNTDTAVGQQQIRTISDEVLSLTEKAKNLQKTTKQVAEESNKIKFDSIAKMPQETVNEMAQKILALRRHLQELRSQPVIDEKAVKRTEDSIDRLGQKFAKMNQTRGTERNVNAALNTQANTLDEIAKKMQRLQAIRANLNIDTQKAQIDRINAALAELKIQLNGVLQRNQQMIASNTALGRSWNYMKNRLAFYFTVGASTSFVKQLIDIRGQYELLDRSIGILIDSAQNGSQIFAELNAMAIKSPFTTMELGAAAKQLVAYDVAAKDVVETTKRIGDMAAAVGIPLERLTYALGQIKAYGYLNARDARMFANAGIPLVKELADYYTELEGRLVSTADVYDRIKKKAIDYSDVMNVVNKMTDEGGKFFDFQEKAADTLKVRIANLALAWNNMLNEMGKDNQGILTEGLKVTKQIFESWRDINNMVIALGLTYGTIKAAQIAYYLWVMRTEKAVGAWSKIINAIDYAFNAKIANVINSLKTSLVGFFTNPAAMLTVAFTALSVALTKAYLDYRDLQAANEEFNKSVVKNAEENVKSIDKFFGDYQKQLESVGSLNSADQTKLWERVQEEIEKTTKNAEKYIEILNKIPEISKRIEMGEEVLEQSKRIQDELKRMAERGEFNIGGGFANDSAAKDLQRYSDIVNELIRKYGTLDEAKKEALKVNEITLETGEVVKQYTGEYAEFQRAQIEAEKELKNIVSTLDKVNIAEVLGSGDMDTQLANVRSFAIAWRDAFLATEKGSKISAEGQALLNSYIDKWIEQQARVNHLIKDENTAAVEANRTAWETFFKFLNTEERKRLDVAIKTNQLGSKSVQELWDNAAERMQEKATTSYNLIQQQIADLRNTPDIVINVVYRNNKEILEKDQEEFEKKYIQPKGVGVLSTDEYLKQEKANREKYGTLMRKQGEDTAEYEKRISDERKSQLELQKKNGDIIEENKNKTDDFSRAVTEQAKKEKQAADDRLKVIKEVEDAGGYDFSTKSERAAANKAAKQAESELAKALKDELSTIDKVRSIYKDLTKEGMSHANAVERATRGWDETVNAINRVLQKNGLKKLDLSKFAGIENPRELVNMLQSQLNTLLKRGAKPADIKELQTKIQTLNVDAEKYDLTKITKGLNNELGKLKDEYELAVELDADPELGSMFASYMGVNLDELPRNAEQAAKKAQESIDKILADNNSSEIIDISSLMDKDAFDDWIKTSGHNLEDGLVKAVSAFRSYLHKVNVDETKNQAQEWNKLLEKYAEYEYKVRHIQNEAEREREIARKKGASQDVFDAINNRERQEIARVSFEKFQKSPEWIAATGDLANMSKSAIGMLIEELERYKRTAKNLSPKEIKQLNNALSKLYKEQRKNNPFKAVANMLDEANERMSIFDEEIEETQKQIDELSKKHKTNLVDGIADDDTQKKLKEAKEKLSKLKEERNNIGKIDASTWVSSINETISAVKSAIEVFDGLAKAIDGVENSDIDKVFSILDSAGKGASTGAAFGGYGAIIGGVVGAAAGVVNAFADVWSGNESINRSIEVSTQKVRALEREYKRLERAVDDAYGTDSIGAQRLMMLNKEAELAELERQLELEKSRKAKNKDQEKIDDLRDKVEELRHEVNNAAREIILDLLEIGDAQDWANDFVKGMIDAFREGENYMESYENAFREMVDNMIAKTIAGKVIGERIEQMIEFIKNTAKARAETDTDVVAARDALNKLEKERNVFYAFREGGENVPEEIFDEINKEIEEAQDRYAEAYTKAAVPTPEDIENVRDRVSSWKDDVKNEFDAYMEAFGVGFGSAKDSQQLSALQQGISQISEQTANSIEAYLNGVSQQVYLHSELLTQIRDVIMGTDSDIQLGVQGQMLLQLQNNYIIMQSIQSMMEGWTTPSGQGIRVELIS